MAPFTLPVASVQAGPHRDPLVLLVARVDPRNRTVLVVTASPGCAAISVGGTSMDKQRMLSKLSKHNLIACLVWGRISVGPLRQGPGVKLIAQ